MTRINTIDPSALTDQHLLAEYRELPRVVTLAAAWLERGGHGQLPEHYTLGPGHVRFFYDKLGWLRRRHAALVAECQRRGFDVRFTDGLSVPSALAGDWLPTVDAVRLCMARLRERLLARDGFYRHFGALVGAHFYNTEEA